MVLLLLFIVLTSTQTVSYETTDIIADVFYKTGQRLKNYGFSQYGMSQFIYISSYGYPQDLLTDHSLTYLNILTYNSFDLSDEKYRQYITSMIEERTRFGNILIRKGAVITMNDFINSFELLHGNIYLSTKIEINLYSHDALYFTGPVELYAHLEYSGGLKENIPIDDAIDTEIFDLITEYMNDTPELDRNEWDSFIQIHNLDTIRPWYQAMLDGLYSREPISPLYFQNRTIPNPK